MPNFASNFCTMNLIAFSSVLMKISQAEPISIRFPRVEITRHGREYEATEGKLPGVIFLFPSLQSSNNNFCSAIVVPGALLINRRAKDDMLGRSNNQKAQSSILSPMVADISMSNLNGGNSYS